MFLLWTTLLTVISLQNNFARPLFRPELATNKQPGKGLNQLMWYYADLEKAKCYSLPNGLPDWNNEGDACMKWRRFGKWVLIDTKFHFTHHLLRSNCLKLFVSFAAFLSLHNHCSGHRSGWWGWRPSNSKASKRTRASGACWCSDPTRSSTLSCCWIFSLRWFVRPSIKLAACELYSSFIADVELLRNDWTTFGHRVEVRSHQTMDVLFRRVGDAAAALQHLPHCQEFHEVLPTEEESTWHQKRINNREWKSQYWHHVGKIIFAEDTLSRGW